MEPHIRKLRNTITDHDPSLEPTNTATAPPPPAAPPLTDQLNLNAHFDTSTMLVFLALLTALFFMGFLSLYVRRLSSRQQNEAIFLSARQRHRNRQSPAPPAQPITKLLPVYAYEGGEAKQGIRSQCAICLGEFEERETVRKIPRCKHVFHVECIDTWLKMRVSCPVCRETHLYEVDGLGMEERSGDQSVQSTRERSTARNDERRGDVEAGSLVCSSSSLGERVQSQSECGL